MKKLSITYLLAANFARGGIRVQIEHANHLAERGHEVSIISPYGPPDWINVTVPWQQQPVEKGKFLGSILPAADITVFSYYEQAFVLYDNLEDLKTLPVYLAQGDEAIFGDSSESGISEDKRKSIEAAHASLAIPYPKITVSSPTRDYILSKGGKYVDVIPNGIDPQRFQPLEHKNNSPLRVLSVGAELPEFKGIKDIYAAVMKLKQNPQCPPFTFVRASPAPNAFSSLPLEVEFHEKPDQQTLSELYASADVFVGASTLESFYLLPLEAMASGTAVVCSDLPALQDYAKPQRDYLPFAPGDIAGLYQMLLLALQSAMTRKQLRENGLRLAAKMTWPEIIERVEQHFYTLLSEKNKWLAFLKKYKKSGKLRYTFEERKP
jgi:glycosyltransferase involved in cell wall biosynthesis